MMDEEIGNRIRFRYAPNRQIPHNHSCLCQPFNWRRNIAPTALSVLNSVFGLPAFRGAQEEIVMNVTGGEPTRSEIGTRPKLEDAPRFVASFYPTNIRYEIIEKQNARSQLQAFI